MEVIRRRRGNFLFRIKRDDGEWCMEMRWRSNRGHLKEATVYCCFGEPTPRMLLGYIPSLMAECMKHGPSWNR